MRLRLKLFRERAGITQKEMAAVLGIPLRTYQNYEHNVRAPSLEVLCKFASTCGASLDELVGYAPRVNVTPEIHPMAARDYDAPCDIARSIRRIRLKNGMTQAEFGDIAGVSSMAVSQWENGRSVPRMGAIRAIASHFKIPASEVVDGAFDSTGKRIAKARALAGMTQRQLADALGITQQSVYYYESGDRDIKSNSLVKISKVLGCTVHYLLGLEDEQSERTAGPSINDEEMELVSLYRRCSAEWREYVMRSASVSASQSHRDDSR